MKFTLTSLFIFLFSFFSFSQELSKEEQKLYDLIMEYRKKNGLPNIPLSSSLTFVAQTHVKDIEDNNPDVGKCNLHSWSNKGSWKPCCYTGDHKQAKCMWDKPRELTSYKGNGYEISAQSNNIKAEEALDLWKNSTAGHYNVIINKGIWKQEWNAIGIGIYKNNAVVWFGHEKD